jgi:hypothetical protein
MTNSELASYELAELVLAMGMVTPRGLVARQLARSVLGVADATDVPPTTAIVTNGTLRLMPRDEPVFLLRGQDALAPLAVREWIKAAKLNGAVTAAMQAEQQAAAMEAWPRRKLPDWPPSQEA